MADVTGRTERGREMHVYQGDQTLVIPLRPSDDPDDRCPGCEGWGCTRCHYTGAVKVRLFYTDWRGRQQSAYATSERALLRRLRRLARWHRPAEVTMGQYHTVGGVVRSTTRQGRVWWHWYLLSGVLPD